MIYLRWLRISHCRQCDRRQSQNCHHFFLYFVFVCVRRNYGCAVVVCPFQSYVHNSDKPHTCTTCTTFFAYVQCVYKNQYLMLYITFWLLFDVKLSIYCVLLCYVVLCCCVYNSKEEENLFSNHFKNKNVNQNSVVIKIFESWLANCLIKSCNTSRGGLFSSTSSSLLFMYFRLFLISQKKFIVCFFFFSRVDGHSNKCWHLIHFNRIILAKLMAFIHFYLQCAEL